MLILQIVLAVLLIVSIVVQSRGAGIGSVMGGGGEFYGTRRGIERLLFKITIGLAVLFVVVSLLSVIVF